jgi:hypothetical protein
MLEYAILPTWRKVCTAALQHLPDVSSYLTVTQQRQLAGRVPAVNPAGLN